MERSKTKFEINNQNKKLFNLLVIFLLIVTFHVIIPFNNLVFDKINIKEVNSINNDISKLYKYFDKNKQKLVQLNFKKIDNLPFQKYQNSIFSIQIYNKNKDSKLEPYFWTNNYINFEFESLKSDSIFFKDNKIIFKKEFQGKIILGIIDVEKLTRLHWKKNTVIFEKNTIQQNFLIETTRTLYNYPVMVNKEVLFYITSDKTNCDFQILFSILFFVVEVFLFISILLVFLKSRLKKYPFSIFTILIIVLFFFKFLLLKYKFPHYLYSLYLFNNDLYFGSNLNPSLGDLLIFLLINQILIYFFYFNIFFNSYKLKKYKIGFLIHSLILIIFSGEVFSITVIFKRIIIESNIWLNFNFFPKLTIYSYIALSIFLISLSNYFILGNKIIRILYNIKLKKWQIILSFLLVFVLNIILYKYQNLEYFMYIILIIIFFSFIIFYLKRHYRINSKIITNFLLIIFATIISSIFLSNYNNKKEEKDMKNYSEFLSFGYNNKFNDDVYLILLNHINNSTIYNNIFKEKFDIKKIHKNEFNKNFLNRSSLIYTKNFSSFYISKQENECKYFLLNNKDSVSVFEYKSIHLKFLKNYKNTDELLTFAIYNNDTLIIKTGNYPYNYYFSYKLDKNSIFIESETTKNYYNKVYLYGKNLKIVINKYNILPISNLVLFSYVFGFNIFLFIILYLIQLLANLSTWNIKLIKFKFNLTNQITFLVISLLILIFASITILSYFNLKNKSNVQLKEESLVKLTTVYDFIKTNLKTNVYYNYNFDEYINSKDFHNYLESFTNSLNVNACVYNYKGHLIFNNKNLNIKSSNNIKIPLYIDPNILYSFYNKNYIYLNEKYQENNKYLLTSIPLYNDIKNLNNLFLVIYTESDDNYLKNDNSKFFVSLFNIFMFLFVIAMIIAYGLSKLITVPINNIINKISKVGLYTKNEHIKYNKNDEIGLLVSQYNKMIDDLDKSAKQIAISERESAWKEMAKQIAHEIKNPLTPMKLRIQYLQKKINETGEEQTELTLQVCDTLIEQIDNLSGIATTFSDFAKIKDPDFNIVDLHFVVKNVIGLFVNIENIIIEFSSNLIDANILADREQVTSIMNNIIKNAIQSCQSSKKSDLKVSVFLFEKDNYYNILIKDNGKGIPKEIVPKIFTPNFTTKSSGTGLGLAITKKFIEQMYGTISFHTIEDIGTEFKISFPKYE